MGIYLVRLTVKMAGTQVFGFSEGFIRVIESPLVAHIAGGTKVERGLNKTLVFNASLSRDPDYFHLPHGKLTTLLFSIYRSSGNLTHSKIYAYHKQSPTDYGKISCQQTICSLRSGYVPSFPSLSLFLSLSSIS